MNRNRLKNFSEIFTRNKHLISIGIIFSCILLQYGLTNIGRLGLISDDWDSFRAVFLFKAENVKEAFDYFMWQTGWNLLQRPFWLTIMPLQLGIFKNNLLGYFLLNLVIFGITCSFLYKTLTLLISSNKLSLLIVLLFISLPLHGSSLYWISAQLSLYSFFFLSFALFMNIKYLEQKNLTHLMIATLFYFVSLLTYESSIGLVPLIVLIALIIKEEVKVKLHFVLPSLLQVPLYYIYKKLLQITLGLDSYTKEIAFETNITDHVFRIRQSLDVFFGKTMFDFIKDSLVNWTNFIKLEYFEILIVGTLILTYFIYKVSKNIESTLTKSQIEYVSIFYLAFLASFGAILIGRYTLGIGSIHDRVNLPQTFLFSVVCVLSLVLVLKSKAIHFITIAIVFFTFINNINLYRFIRAYEIQQDFIKQIQTINIKENTIVKFRTNIKDYQGVPVLNSVWGISYIISNTKGIIRLEAPFNESRYNQETNTYKSLLFPNYIFENPNIIEINYFHPEDNSN